MTAASPLLPVAVGAFAARPSQAAELIFFRFSNLCPLRLLSDLSVDRYHLLDRGFEGLGFRPSIPGMAPLSLAAALDERCRLLTTSVSASVDSLAHQHREHVARDKEKLTALAADVNSLRKAMRLLDEDLNPKLMRLAAAEPQHAALAKWNPHAMHMLRLPPSSASIQAAKKLQAAWRRRQAFCHAASAASAFDFCPTALQRSILQGIRQPLPLPMSTAVSSMYAEKATANRDDALPTANTANATTSSESASGVGAGHRPEAAAGDASHHFMSIL